MTKIPSFCLFLALSFSAPVFAQSEDSPVTIKGAGGAPCAEAVRVFGPSGTPEDRGLYLQWATGLSVGAALSNQIVDVSPTGEIMDLVHIALLVCQEPAHAEDRWFNAVSTAIGRVRPYWAKQPARVSITYEGATHWIYEDSIRQLQTDLGKLGYQVTVDGKFGNNTGAAIAAVQETIGIPNKPVPTGMLFYGLTRPPQ